MKSRKRVQGICGPIGSGKTTANFVKHILNAARQQRSTIDGIRKYKLCVVRDTYRQLWSTTIPTWNRIASQDTGEWTGSKGGPASHVIKWERGGVEIHLTVEFVAIGENAAEDVLRGYEPTAFYLNEGDLLQEDVYTEAFGRLDRYPAMTEGGATWSGITIDMNAPVLSSWAYDKFYRHLHPDFDFFRQPSGFAENAENLHNLAPGYYRLKAIDQPEWWVRRMIECVPGFTRVGKPVYPEFNDTLHVASTEILPFPMAPLIIGLDAGLSPAGAICQAVPGGRFLVLDELVTIPGTGSLRFAELLNDLLKRRYSDHLASFRRGVKAIRGYADPAAQFGVDRMAGEASWIDIVERACGFRIDPATTNAVIRRHEAVRLPLTMFPDGKPRFQLSPVCITIREGFNSGYHFKEVRSSGAVRDVEEVEKNRFSHVHDALQYAAMGGGFDTEVMSRQDARHAGGFQTMAINEDHPHGEYIGRSAAPGQRQLRAISEEY